MSLHDHGDKTVSENILRYDLVYKLQKLTPLQGELRPEK